MVCLSLGKGRREFPVANGLLSPMVWRNAAICDRGPALRAMMIYPGNALMLHGGQQRGPCGSQVYLPPTMGPESSDIHGPQGMTYLKQMRQKSVGAVSRSPVAIAAIAVVLDQPIVRLSVQDMQRGFPD